MKGPTRRLFIKNLGMASAAITVAPFIPLKALASENNNKSASVKIDTNLCQMSPEEMSGPYFVNEKLIRRCIVEDQEGIPLLLNIKIIDSITCKPIEDLLIDIWHCNAFGKYSGWRYINPDLEAPSDDIGTISRTDSSTFLRGAQKTNKDGLVRFCTIFPGFYAGRAIHIHVSARKANVDKRKNEKFYFVSQLYFNESISSEVTKNELYSPREIKRLKNNEDSIFSGVSNGAAVIFSSKIGNELEDGVFGSVTLSIDTSKSSEKINTKDLFKYTV